ncbi:C40 family peptidase [Paenibacillus tarimensis]
MLKTKIIRSVICVGLCTALTFTTLGLGQAAVPVAEAATLSKADRILNTGKKYLGTPYRFGAPAGVTHVFDCSSFTQYIFKKNGISLPRTSKAQAKRGKFVSKANLRKGDLVFFSVPSRTGNSIGHVGVYAGNGRILHTYGKGGVKYSSIKTGYWKNKYITARRVI